MDFLFFLCSHAILQVPQDVPNNTLDLPHMVCSKFNSHVYKLKRWATWEHNFFYVCNLRLKQVLLLGGAQCYKKLMMYQLIRFLEKK